ncbi:hypothetical protein HY485_03850 [Candidatus Woesearchaeota archaeon]|nr:hypothetical protein [Candidatus Woesearchaeota archaeon]
MANNKKKLDLLNRINTALEQGKLTEDTPAVLEYKRLFPKSATPYIFLGAAHEREQNYQAAFESHHKALDILVEGLEKNTGNLLVIIQVHESLVTNAVRHYTKNFTAPQRASLARTLLKEGFDDTLLYYVLGEDAFNKDNYAEAKTLMDKVLTARKPPIQKIITEAYIIRGLCNIALNNPQDGEQDLTTAIKRDAAKEPLIKEYRRIVREQTHNYGTLLDDILTQDFGKPDLDN